MPNNTEAESKSTGPDLCVAWSSLAVGEGQQEGIISTGIEAWMGGPYTAYAPVGAAQLRAAVQSQLQLL